MRHVPLVDSDGRIPKGWKAVPLQDVADARRGISWDRSNEVNTGLGVPVVTIPNIKMELTLHDMTRLPHSRLTSETGSR